MKASVSKSPHRIGWIRVSAYHPAEPQREALEAYGCKRAIFSTEENETLAAVLHAMRAGDEVVVHGLSRFGATRAEAVAALEAVRKAGARVYDTRTEAYITGSCLESALEAIGEWNGEARMPSSEIARARGKKGGGKPGVMRVTKAEAVKIWNDPELTDAVKAHRIGLSVRSCFRRLPPRKLPAGRKPKS